MAYRRDRELPPTSRKAGNSWKALGVATIAGVLLSACASEQIIVDRKGVNQAQYQRDLSDCQGYAAQYDHSAEIAKSAGVAAIIGAAVGAIWGDSDTAAKAAGSAAVGAGAKEGLRGEHKKEQIVKRCLRGRGYRVLN